MSHLVSLLSHTRRPVLDREPAQLLRQHLAQLVLGGRVDGIRRGRRQGAVRGRRAAAGPAVARPGGNPVGDAVRPTPECLALVDRAGPAQQHQERGLESVLANVLLAPKMGSNS
jgi:hypothetical protein